MDTPFAIITGGTKGIGLAIAERLLAGGWRVAVCARSIEPVGSHPALAEGRMLAVAADLSLKTEAERFAKEALDWGGTPALLVNNTGTFRPGQIQNEEEGVFELQWQTNVASAYHLTRALLPQMIKAKAGHIVNMCSTASIEAYVNGGSYCISKYALLGFSRVLREELKQHRIRVTSLLPGATLTDSWSGTTLPAERFISPGDIADLLWTIIHANPQTVVEEVVLRPLEGDID